MMAPHWLDKIVGNHHSVESIGKAIVESSEFKTLVGMAIERGKEVEAQIKANPKITGANYEQTVRAFIARGFNTDKAADFGREE